MSWRRSATAIPCPAGWSYDKVFDEPNTTVTTATWLPTGTLTVGSTSAFPATGTLMVDRVHRVTYTGKTSTTFTGCTGGNGYVKSGQTIKMESGSGVGFLVRAIPDKPGSSAGAVLGFREEPVPEATFTVFRKNDVSYALRANGHVEFAAADTGGFPAQIIVGTAMSGAQTVSGLKTLLDAIDGGYRRIHFRAGFHTFGLNFNHSYTDPYDTHYTGDGDTQSFVANYTTGKADIEPFSFTRGKGVRIFNLGVSGGGDSGVGGISSIPVDTCDAIDFDGGTDVQIDRVRIIASRDRGIVFDGKDTNINDHSLAVDSKISRVMIDGLFPIWSALQGTQDTSGASLTVESNRAFPSSGALWIGNGNYVTYTGKSGTSGFTGCTGGSGTYNSTQLVCWVPSAPTLSATGTGTLTSQAYTYYTTVTDQYYRESKLSPASATVTPNGSQLVRVTLPALPAGMLCVKLYRKSAAQTTIYLVGTFFTVPATYDDNASDATLIADPGNLESGRCQAPESTISKKGIELLGANRVVIDDYTIRGVGGQGISLQRGKDVNVGHTRIGNGTIVWAGSTGIQARGTKDGVIDGAIIIDPGVIQSGEGIVVVGESSGGDTVESVNERLRIVNVNCLDRRATKRMTYGVRVRDLASGTAVKPTQTTLDKIVVRGALTASVRDEGDNTYIGHIERDGALQKAGVDTIDADIYAISAVLSGGGSAIASGTFVDVPVPITGTIESWALIGDQSGSLQVSVRKEAAATWPPTSTESIVASAPLVISGAVQASSSTLTGWTTEITTTELLRFWVDSLATSITQATAVLYVRKRQA